MRPFVSFPRIPLVVFWIWTLSPFQTILLQAQFGTLLLKHPPQCPPDPTTVLLPTIPPSDHDPWWLYMIEAVLFFIIVVDPDLDAALSQGEFEFPSN